MDTYITRIRYARFENGKRVEYLPGSKVQLTAEEAGKFAAGTLTADSGGVSSKDNPEIISIPAFSKQLRERKETARLVVADKQPPTDGGDDKTNG